MTAPFRWLRQNLVGGALVALFLVLLVYPLARLLLLPWLPSFGTESVAPGAGAAGLSLAAVENSFRLALLSVVFAVPFGVAFGWLLERRRWRGNQLLALTLWLLFLIPSYILTTGWQIVFSAASLRHGLLASFFFSQIGIVGLLALKGLPFACFAARSSWRAIGAEIEDAARIHILSAPRRAELLLRLLLPAAGSAGAVVFVESIQDFGIPATLGAELHLPIVTYAIYQNLVTMPVNFAGAARLGWSLVLMAVAAALVHLWLVARYSGILMHSRRRVFRREACGPISRSLATAAWLLVAILGIAVPGAAIIDKALPPIQIHAAVSIPWLSLGYSTIYGASAGLLAVLLAVVMLDRQRRSGGVAARTADILSFANMAVPGLVLGAAYIIAFNSTLLPLYGTPLLLVLAYVAAITPMLIRLLQAPMTQIHSNMNDAARLHRVPFASRLVDIQAPLLLVPAFWGWAMAFGQIYFELPISELLYPPGRPPIGVTLVLLNQYLYYGDEARVALAGIGVCLVVIGSLALLIRVLAPGAVEEFAR